MGYDINGVFTRSYDFETDRNNGLKIMAARVDGEFDNFATGANLAFLRNGAAPMAANLRMGGFSLTGLADGTTANPSLAWANDASSGFYRAGLNQLGVSIANANAATIDATGLQVVGQIKPSQNLRIVSSIALATPTGNGFCDLSGNSSAGLNIIGQGSTYDISFYDKTGVRRAAIDTGAQWEFFGSPISTTPPAGNNSTRIATTAFVATSFAPLASPTFTGVPAAPTPATADNSTTIATTAFVKNQAYAPLASPTFTGVPAAPTPVGTDNSTTIATTAYVKGQAYATLASPALTGTPTAPTATVGTNTTQIATTAYVLAAGFAPLASPTFTGTPAAPTPATADNSTTIATTAFVKAQAYAPLASPTFTGTPAAPTASAGTNTTQVATTAFVQTALQPVLQSTASSATVTPTFSQDAVTITAQAVALNLANWTGTAIDFWGIVVRIKDNGTARAITYGTNYQGTDTVSLPSTTIVGKTHELTFQHNSTTGKHVCVSAITY